MKTLSGILLSLLFPFIVFAQYHIEGTVVDKQSRELLVGASIIIKNTQIGTQTDEQGFFKLSQLNSGHYTIRVSYLGYFTLEQKLDLTKGNTNVKLELSPAPIVKDEVVIQASKADENTPATFQNMNKADIQKVNLGKDLPMLLAQTPSIVSTSDAGTGIGYTNLWIRGTDIQRINVTVNGIPLNDAESHGVYFVDLPDMSSSTQNIQIQRGVGTSTNGAAAFGASINILTNTLNEKAYAELSNSFGSFNTRKHSLSAGTGLINKRWSFDARLSKISSDGFIDRASADLTSYHLSAAWYGKKSMLKFNIMSGMEETYQAWYGVPKDMLETQRTFNPYTYENEVDHYKQDHYQLHYSGNISKKWCFNTALHYTRGLGYYEQYKENQSFTSYGLDEIKLTDTVMYIGEAAYIFPDSTIHKTDIIRRKWLDNHFYGAIASLKYNNRKNLDIVLSSGWNQYRGDHYGNIIWSQFASNGAINHQWYFNRGVKTDFNGFAKANYKVKEDIYLYGDLQFRMIQYKIDGNHDDLRDLSMEKEYFFLNPKAGILYNLNTENTFYLAFAVANREPNRSNFKDADDGQLPLPERLTDFELGYKYKGKKLDFEANSYFMMYKDQLVLTGEINNVGAPIMTNVDNSYRAGIELVGSVQLHENLSWQANLTISQNKILNFREYVDNWDYWNDPANEPYQYEQELGTTDIAFSPNLIMSSLIDFRPFTDFSISLQSKYVGKQYIDNTSDNDRVLDAYFVNNVLIAYDVPLEIVNTLQLQLQLNNVFNEMYETNAWVYRYFYEGVYNQDFGYFPQAGFNVMGGIHIRF
jgi:iron complex outermembrane receptor protein